MIQDLVVYLVYIGYALGVLMTFGTVLTWVERKQAAVMSDRIGANRAYVRIPFTQFKMIWLGLFHGLADGLKMLLKEDWKPQSYDWYAYAVAPWVVFTPVLLVFAVIPFGGIARSGEAAAGYSRRGRLVRRPDLPDADRPARCRPADRVRVRRHVDHRRDARRLVVVEQVLDAGGAARRLADDLLRADHGADRPRADPHLRHGRPHRDRPAAVGHAAGVPARVGRLPPAVRRDAVPRRRDRREQAHPLRPAGSGVRAHRRLLHRVQRDEDGPLHVRGVHRDRDRRGACSRRSSSAATTCRS